MSRMNFQMNFQMNFSDCAVVVENCIPARYNAKDYAGGVCG